MTKLRKVIFGKADVTQQVTGDDGTGPEGEACVRLLGRDASE